MDVRPPHRAPERPPLEPTPVIAERLLTRRLRSLRAQQLALEPHRLGNLPAPTRDGGYLLYAHVPFCELLCPYCSFNRFPFQEEMARASLRDEQRMVADLGYRFTDMHVGGGTPTVLVDALASTVDLARELFDIDEVSTETNPNHVTEAVLGPLDGRVQRMSVRSAAAAALRRRATNELAPRSDHEPRSA